VEVQWNAGYLQKGLNYFGITSHCVRVDIGISRYSVHFQAHQVFFTTKIIVPLITKPEKMAVAFATTHSLTK
jgi:hypothetical protein